MHLILHTKLFYYAFTITNVYWPFWNSHKGSPPKNNGHSFNPHRFTGNLGRRREGTSRYCTCFLLMRAQCMCEAGGQNLSPGDPSFCSHVIKPLRTAVCISFDVGPGASVSVRLWEGVEDTSCWNTCEGFSFRPLQRGVGLISDHIKVCLRKLEEQRTSADLIVPTFWKRDTSTSRASDLRFKSP